VNDVLEIVSKLERTGGILSLNGDQIEYAIPRGNREAQELLDELRRHRERVADFLRLRACESVECYPPESLNRVLRFGQPHAKLFMFIGRKVRTPNGLGTLLQVFADRATVLLDSERDHVCVRFLPSEVIPVAPEEAYA
jgi:hypothetical protein